MKLRRLLRGLRNLVLILLACFALGEAALRVHNWFRPSYIFYDASYNRFRGKPYSNHRGVKLNSLGFKGSEFALDKGGALRIIGMGDSFVFGVVPYEHTFLKILESHLDLDKAPVEVYNMGIPKTGPLDHLSLLVNEGLRYQPDLVLVSVFVGNDFFDTNRTVNASRSLVDRSYVLSLLRFAVFIRPAVEPDAMYAERPYQDDRPTFREPVYLRMIAHRARVYQTTWERFQTVLDDMVASLDKMAQLCDRSGARFTVVLIPEETQIDPGLQRALVERHSFIRLETTDFKRPNRELRRRLSELGIDVLDLYQPFLEASKHTRLYKPRDTHWNIAGNRLAGSLVAEHLRAIVHPESD
jgi:hypothetical protein